MYPGRNELVDRRYRSLRSPTLETEVLLRHGLNLEKYTAGLLPEVQNVKKASINHIIDPGDPCAPHGMVLTELFSLAARGSEPVFKESVATGLLLVSWLIASRESISG